MEARTLEQWLTEARQTRDAKIRRAEALRAEAEREYAADEAAIRRVQDLERRRAGGSRSAAPDAPPAESNGAPATLIEAARRVVLRKSGTYTGWEVWTEIQAEAPKIAAETEYKVLSATLGRMKEVEVIKPGKGGRFSVLRTVRRDSQGARSEAEGKEAATP